MTYTLTLHATGAIRNQGMTIFNRITGREQEAEISPRTQQAEMQGLTFIYSHDLEKDADSTIFSPARVQEMCRIESILTQHPLYPLFCQVDHTPKP